jgi:hypothetical protein
VREQLNYVCEHDLPMPCDDKTTRLAVFRVYANLVSHANLDGLAWVSAETQAAETGQSRWTVNNARELLQRAGRLERTDERKARGVIVWRVLVPEYQPPATERPPVTDASSRGSDRGSSRGSDRGSSRGSDRGETASNGAVVDVQQGTEQNMNINPGLQQLLDSAALKCSNDWRPKTRDDTRPTPQAFLQLRRDVWAPEGERLLSEYPGAELRHLVPLLLDDCGDKGHSLTHQLRQYHEREARDQRASRSDGTTTIGAAVEKLHRHLTPDTARSA